MKKALLIAILLLAGCIGTQEDNIAYHGDVVEYGDNVSINYVLMVDDRIVDTNVEEIARENKIYSVFRNYGPLNFTVLLGESRLLPAFVSGIVGMRKNESRMLTILPRDGYGEYNASLRYEAPRYYNKSAFEKIPRSYFEEKNLTVENGTAFEVDSGTFFITDYDNETVTIMYLFEIGGSFDYNGFHQVVTDFRNETYTIMFDVRVNGTYDTISQVTGKPTVVRVTNLTNDTIIFDENHPLAGKTLLFNISLVDLQKQTAE